MGKINYLDNNFDPSNNIKLYFRGEKGILLNKQISVHT